MNVFCRLFGHTWIPITETPKVSWNTGDDGLVLHAKSQGEVEFFDECVRCRERRSVVPVKKFAKN